MFYLITFFLVAVAFSVAHLLNNPTFPYRLDKDFKEYKEGALCKLLKDKKLEFKNGSTLKVGGDSTHYPLRLRFIYKLLTLCK